MKVTLAEQIAEVERELAMRGRVYPSFVARGKLSQADADGNVHRLEAVRDTLEWLRRNEAKIREAVKF